MAGKKRLIWQLYPSYLLILVISLIAVTWYASVSARLFFLDQAEKDLKARALLFERQITDYLEPLDDEKIDLLCKNAGRESSTRITIILPAGRVVGDSESDPGTMDNHADRPEVISALKEGNGTSMRYSRTLDRNLMYTGIPVKKDGRILAVVRTSVAVDVIDQTIRAIQGKIIIAGVIIAVFASLISLIVSRRISQPIEKLKKTADNFINGDFNYRMPLSNIEEIGGLYETMKGMAQDLHQRISTITQQRNEIEAMLSSMTEGVIAVDMEERIINMNNAAARMLECDSWKAKGQIIQEAVRNSVFQDFVSDALLTRKNVEKEMELSAEEEKFIRVHGTILLDADENRIGALIVLNDITQLRKLENIRREFVANVSHELKTPITAIKGFIETLSDDRSMNQGDRERFFEIITKHANRLEAIVEDLLCLSRIEKDEETTGIKLTEANIRDVLDTAMQVCMPNAKSKKVTMELDCDIAITAKIDPPLLEQAVVNLLDNAIKFSPENSLIEVEAMRDKKELTINIIDRGIGIESEHLSRLFERFYRVDRARSRKLGGTGLGLSIVKHIANAHGGHVTVISSPGKGSTFSIHLPAK